MPSTTTLEVIEVLSSTQKAHFLEYGWIKVPKCFTRAQAAEFTLTMWTRLGMDPNDKSTWHTERTNMPWHKHVPVKDFAPRAWAAMCELLGGEERITETPTHRGWGDGFIVNLGRPEFRAEDELNMRENEGHLRPTKCQYLQVTCNSGRDSLTGWHNDGDFFVHFLDSPEQALLVIPLWSDIIPKAGGTVICTDGIKHLAKLLYDHPEGTTPWMRSLNDPTHATFEGRQIWQDLAWDRSRCRDESFVEMTGETGDVILMHPLMLHTASENLLRIPRIITNPPISLKEPFDLDRKDSRDYSLVEQKTLIELGQPDGLKGWKITNERRPWISKRIKLREEARQKELERLKDEQA